MSEQPKVGAILDAEQPRDAIHVAIVSVIADERLVPGSHVGFTRKDSIEHVGVRTLAELGVVDPYLTKIVEREQRFYLFLYPQTITSLRHNWTHPAFVALGPTAKDASELWLKSFAARVGVSYETLMEVAHENVTGSGRGYYVLNYDTPECVYQESEEMWKHYEVVTGEKPSDTTETLFSCAC